MLFGILFQLDGITYHEKQAVVLLLGVPLGAVVPGCDVVAALQFRHPVLHDDVFGSISFSGIKKITLLSCYGL